MATVHTINLIVHIISGFTALTTGLVPMLARKGGKAHNFWGTVYFWAMFGVFVTSVVSWIQEPHRVFLQFLMFIGFFSFHFTLTGVRTLRLKKAADRPVPFDWAVAWIAIIAGTGISLFGASTVIRGWLNGSDIAFFNYLYLGGVSSSPRTAGLITTSTGENYRWKKCTGSITTSPGWWVLTLRP